MAFDTFLDLGTIAGESTAKGFEKKIEIFSFSWGASNPVTVDSSKGGISSGKVSISSFNVMKRTEASSPLLFEACCKGTHIPKMKVSLRKAGGDAGQEVYLTYDFDECMVESVQWSGSSGGDDVPTESVSFAFAKCTVEYKLQDKQGKVVAGGPKPVMWDLTTVSAT